jgi:hypothetical protein
LDKAFIQLRFDRARQTPRLNVHATPSTVTFWDDPDTAPMENKVLFQAYSNYPAFVKRSEVRLFKADQSLQSEPLEILPLNADAGPVRGSQAGRPVRGAQEAGQVRGSQAGRPVRGAQEAGQVDEALRIQAIHLPGSIDPPIPEPIVKAVLSFLPELDLMRGEEIPAPVRRAGNFGPGIT